MDHPDRTSGAASGESRLVIAVVASWVLILLTVFAVSVGHQVVTCVREAQQSSDDGELAALARSGIAFSQHYLDEWFVETTSAASLGLRAAITGGGPDAAISRPESDLSWQDDPRLRAIRVGAGWVSLGRVVADAGRTRTVHGIEDENRRVPLVLLDARAVRSIGGLSPEAIDALDAVRTDPDRFGSLDPRAWPRLDARSRETIARLITPYARRVNVNTASIEVLVALGIPAEGARKLVAHRNGPDGVQSTADDRLFTTLEDTEGGLRACGLGPSEASTVAFLVGRGYLTTQSDVFRVRSRGWVEEFGPWCEIEAVLDRSSGRWEVRSWTRTRSS